MRPAAVSSKHRDDLARAAEEERDEGGVVGQLDEFEADVLARLRTLSLCRGTSLD